MSSGRRFSSLHLHEMILTRIFNAAWKRSRNIMENKCLRSFPGFSFSHYLRTSSGSRRMTGAFHLVYNDIYRCHKSEFTLIGRPSFGLFKIADVSHRIWTCSTPNDGYNSFKHSNGAASFAALESWRQLCFIEACCVSFLPAKFHLFWIPK